jgi:hypothetical protein
LSTYNECLSSPVDFTLDLDTSISAHDASVVLDSYVEKMMESPFAQLAEAGKESTLWAASATAEEARLEAQEEQEYQAALAASCDFSPYASSFSPPLSSQLASSSFIPTSPTPPPSQPVWAQLPPILTTVTPASHRPTITTQMNPAWMREYEDKRNTVVVKKGVPQVDPVITRRFQIVYWDRDGESLMVHSIHDCPTWPIWCLSEAPEVLAGLGADIMAIDQYDVKHCYWKQTDFAYPHCLTMECSLFLRRRKVACSALEEWVACLLPNCLDIRLEMKAQRDGIWEDLKRQQKQAAPESSDLEVEIVETTRRSSK